jgi:hypothetical protein
MKHTFSERAAIQLASFELYSDYMAQGLVKEFDGNAETAGHDDVWLRVVQVRFTVQHACLLRRRRRLRPGA